MKTKLTSRKEQMHNTLTHTQWAQMASVSKHFSWHALLCLLLRQQQHHLHCRYIMMALCELIRLCTSLHPLAQFHSLACIQAKRRTKATEERDSFCCCFFGCFCLLLLLLLMLYGVEAVTMAVDAEREEGRETTHLTVHHHWRFSLRLAPASITKGLSSFLSRLLPGPRSCLHSSAAVCLPMPAPLKLLLPSDCLLTNDDDGTTNNNGSSRSQ